VRLKSKSNLLEEWYIPSFFGIRMRSSNRRGAQEGQRSPALGVFLERISNDMHEHVQGCVPELVLNLDEVGISDWEDHKTKKVIVLAAMLGRTIHHGVSRNTKRISVIASMSAAGESLLHYILTSQNSPTVQTHLKKQSVRFGSLSLARNCRLINGSLLG
jgi:hypothetical protein